MHHQRAIPSGAGILGANVVPNYPVPRHTKATLPHPSPSGFSGDGSSWVGSVGDWGGLIISWSQVRVLVGPPPQSALLLLIPS